MHEIGQDQKLGGQGLRIMLCEVISLLIGTFHTGWPPTCAANVSRNHAATKFTAWVTLAHRDSRQANRPRSRSMRLLCSEKAHREYRPDAISGYYHQLGAFQLIDRKLGMPSDEL